MKPINLLDGEALVKTFKHGAGRVATPARTLARLASSLSPMGITRVANVTGLDKIGIPVVMVCRPNSRSLAVFQGKGVELDAARVSGLMEAIETYHGETILDPLKFASYKQMLDRHVVLDCHSLPLSAGGYFHHHRPMHWIEGYDLVQRRAVWVPYEVVHTDYSSCAPPASGCFRLSTNGLASGNHLLEAISQGLYEVIERDATTLWNFLDQRGRQETEIDLDSVDDALCVTQIQRCVKAGLEVRIWDASTDIRVPVFVAELRETSASKGAVWASAAFGSGCYCSRQIALLRALTEAAQARTTFISGARDDMSWDDYESADQEHLALRTGHTDEPEYRCFSATESWPTETLQEDIQHAADRLAAVGLEQIIVVDLTQSRFGIPVVRVIVPGLEGPDEYFSDFVPGLRARNRYAGRAEGSP